jgi:hypothetical protein
MPPKKKKDDDTKDPFMRAARFGRVKNTLTMGFGEFMMEDHVQKSLNTIIVCRLLFCLLLVVLLLLILGYLLTFIHSFSTFFAHIHSCTHSHSTATLSFTRQTVGLPNVGKSTLTNMLAGANHLEAANYPFCTIDPSVVQCVVPDKNYKYLVDTWKSPSVVPAVLKVTDIAGLIKGASEGAGLGNAFLSHIAAVDGLYHLIRAFDSDEVIHVDDSVDPIRDLDTIVGELCAKDRETLSKLVEAEKVRVRKEKGLARAAEPPLSEDFTRAFEKCSKLIESNTPIQTHEDFSMGEVELIKDWGLST